MRVRLEYVPTRNGGIRQQWVAEDTVARGIFAGQELEGRGRTRLEAIRRLASKPYGMDFDSVEWKVRLDFSPGICKACSSGLDEENGSCPYCESLIAAGL